jgi:hypothetical protein
MPDGEQEERTAPSPLRITYVTFLSSECNSCCRHLHAAMHNADDERACMPALMLVLMLKKANANRLVL